MERPSGPAPTGNPRNRGRFLGTAAAASEQYPAHLVYPIRGMYLDAISRASDHLYITTAYFIPDQQILGALLKASRRGVDVRVILPEDSNHVLADWLSAASTPRCWPPVSRSCCTAMP